MEICVFWFADFNFLISDIFLVRDVMLRFVPHVRQLWWSRGDRYSVGSALHVVAMSAFAQAHICPSSGAPGRRRGLCPRTRFF